MEDVITGEVLDFFGGREDLKNGILRHVDNDHFAEDPLRVLRAAQFAARFGFSVAPETVDLCKSIDLSTLSSERVEAEFKKAMLKAGKPSVFFEVLRQMEQLGVWFPEVQSMIGVEQDPLFHPEGDVWVHSMEVLDRAAMYRNKTSDPYSFMLLALTHDFGKIVCTELINGRIHAYGHETMGEPVIAAFLDRIVHDKSVKAYVLNMVPLHMRPNVAAYSKPPLKSTNKLFDEAQAPEDLVWFAMCDKPVLSGTVKFSGDSEFLFERLAAYKDLMAKPFVQGRDLIEAGLEPGEDFREILEHAHKLRLAGIEKDSALKQTLAFARTLRKKNASAAMHKAAEDTKK
jgi:tRNA nucleotidyltransferase (CCA-adding enzyme)